MIGSKVKELGQRFFNEILVTQPGVALDPLVKLYHNLMRAGLTFVRCQSEELFLNSQIIDMIKKFGDQMNVEMTPSLPSEGILSNTDENLQFLSLVMQLRGEGTASWDYVRGLRDIVAWQPAQ